MSLWNKSSVGSALGGKLLDGVQDFQAMGVTIDSRKTTSGDLFIAIRGKNFDGHQFAKEAEMKGAVAAIVSKVQDLNIPQVVVSDTHGAIWQMAAYARSRLKAKVLGVTGSVGKTTSKEMLRAILQNEGVTHANLGNFNNHYGLPLTLLNAPSNCAFMVLEMGMSLPGEISPMSIISKPDISLITTVEAVHLNAFASVEDIAIEKSAIMDGMRSGGKVVINIDNPYHPLLLKYSERLGLEALTFSTEHQAYAKMLSCASLGDKTEVTAMIGDQSVSYQLQMPGMHHVRNSLGVLATACAAGADLSAAAQALSEFLSLSGRGKSYQINGVTIIDESYNASPAAVKQAIIAASGRLRNGRFILALGDMVELGPTSQQKHLELADVISAYGVDHLYTVGRLTKALAEAVPDIFRSHYDTSSELAISMPEVLQPGDVLLIKGSRLMAMEKILESILQCGT